MALYRKGSLRSSITHLSLLVSLPPLPTLAQAEFPLTLLPIYTQATGYVGSCASSASSTFITSFGCDSFSNPGPCLCTNELSSSKIAYEISSCAWGIDLAHSDIDSATQLWRDYCRTNGGVSVIHEESKLQNIPLFTQVTGYVSSALAAATDSFVETFGCSEYIVAPCLCGDPGSSAKVWEEASTRAGNMLFGEESIAQLFSGSMLWSSFCQVNLATPASRTVVAPIKVDATPTGSADSTSTTDYYATPGSTADTTYPTSSPSDSGNTDNSSSSDSSESDTNWEAIGAVVGVIGILTALGVAWWTNRKNQWAIHAIGRLGWHQHNMQMQQQNAHVQHQQHSFGRKGLEAGNRERW